MVEYFIVLLMVVAGYLGASPWLIPVGILGLCIGSFENPIVLLRAVSVFNALCACVAGYVLGVCISTFLA